MDIASVRSRIEKYLGKPVDELYASFDEKPLSSASIAQVHRATLFDGTVVAVKIRRPGICLLRVSRFTSGASQPVLAKTVHWTVFRALKPSKPSKSARPPAEKSTHSFDT
ncbi:MAG: hypothetical protein IJ124_09590 [Clostridia bacterium]|nr:hypothetical protein [Clostridia bacterium]